MITRLLFSFIYVFVSLICNAQYEVKQFGAKGDGRTIDTKAIQAAIDSAFNQNGGVVIFSPGKYKTGTLTLKSNIELHLMPGATIIGSENIADYYPVQQQYESRTKELYAKYFLIYAENQQNISITGSGTIDGNGLKNFQQVRPQNERPFLIRLVKCKAVMLKDVQLLEAANWTLHLLACTDVHVQAVTIVTTAEGNRDGIDIDACHKVTISDCHISTTDDAIVLKSTSDEVCDDVAISNCILSSKGSTIKTGTESNGGFRNIVVNNCVIRNVPDHTGVELMTVDGGVMENILIQNIVMYDVATPFFIRIGLRARPFKSRQYAHQIGNASGISLNNISVHNARLPSSIIGVSNKKITGVSVTNYTVNYSTAQTAIPFNKVPALEFEYPAANMFTNLPAFAMYCRDVDGLYLQDIKIFSSANDEQRPALVFDKVSNLQLMSMSAGLKTKSASATYFRNCKNVTASFCQTAKGGKSVFEVEGKIAGHELFVNNLAGMSPSLISRSAQLPEIEDKDRSAATPVTRDIKKGPITINGIIPGGETQLFLFVSNDAAKPGKIRISYKDVQQEFVIDWQEWGWAPVSLLKSFIQGETVAFIIENEKGSSIRLEKYFLRSHDTGYTD